MKNLLKKYGALVFILGSLLTGIQIFGPAFLLFWLLNEVRVAVLIAVIVAIAWIVKQF